MAKIIFISTIVYDDKLEEDLLSFKEGRMQNR